MSPETISLLPSCCRSAAVERLWSVGVVAGRDGTVEETALNGDGMAADAETIGGPLAGGAKADRSSSNTTGMTVGIAGAAAILGMVAEAVCGAAICGI